MLFFVISIGIAVFDSVASQTVCPEIQGLPTFKFEQYIEGTWYEVARIEYDFERDNDCTIVTFDTKEKSNIKYFVDAFNNKKPHHHNGTMTTRPGTILARSEYYEGVPGNTMEMKVLAFEPKSYAVLHCCYSRNGERNEVSWIISRTKTMDDATKEKVKGILDEHDIIDADNFRNDEFNDDSCNPEE